MSSRSSTWVGVAIGAFVLSVTSGNATMSAVLAADHPGEERRVPNVDSRTWSKLEQVQELIKSEEYADALSTLERWSRDRGATTRTNSA